MTPEAALSSGPIPLAEPATSPAQPLGDSQPIRVDEWTAPGCSVGQLLAGKYRVERRLGEGAMGVVLAATHVGLNQTVAVKFIRAEAAQAPDVLTRFSKEARVAAKIKSEHVVRVIDVDETPPIGPYIVMEYLEGHSLGEILEREGPMSIERAAAYLLQACEGLAAAHAIGVIHRDIKPENLFVTRQNHVEVVKLLDFGISKTALTGAALGDDLPLHQTGYVMGTPLYMSPEQIRSDPQLDARTDIWSMGAVFYELVTGQTAFIASSITEICARILEGPAPSLVNGFAQAASAGAAAAAASAAGRADVACVERIITRCLQKDPALRYSNVAELARDLLPLSSREARAYAARASSILSASGLELRELDSRQRAAAIPSEKEKARGSKLTVTGVLAGLCAALLVIVPISLWSSSEPRVAPAARAPAPSASAGDSPSDEERASLLITEPKLSSSEATYPETAMSKETMSGRATSSAMRPEGMLPDVGSETTHVESIASSDAQMALPRELARSFVDTEQALERAASRKARAARERRALPPRSLDLVRSAPTSTRTAALVDAPQPAAPAAEPRLRLVEPAASRIRLVDVAGPSAGGTVDAR